MRRTLLGITLFCLTTTAFSQTIQVNVTDIEIEKGGYLKIALTNDNNYPKKECIVQHQYIKIETTPMVVKFDSVKAGAYAINIFHDENSNNKLDLKFGMFPKEGYGFSNNPKLKGPPNFERNKFDFDGTEFKLDIQLRY